MPSPKGPGFIPCTNCGGTGATDRDVIERDPKTGKTTTRRIRVVCTVCGGKGGRHI